MEWGAAMARRRESARLARAAEMAEDVRLDDVVGQFLVLGFGGIPRLLELRVKGRRMCARDVRSGRSVSVNAAEVWKIAGGKYDEA